MRRMLTENEIKAMGGTTVSGTNDGTNWTSITIDGTTKNIPAGGSGTKKYLHQIYIDYFIANPDASSELHFCQLTFNVVSTDSTAFTKANFTSLYPSGYKTIGTGDMVNYWYDDDAGEYRIEYNKVAHNIAVTAGYLVVTTKGYSTEYGSLHNKSTIIHNDSNWTTCTDIVVEL